MKRRPCGQSENRIPADARISCLPKGALCWGPGSLGCSHRVLVTHYDAIIFIKKQKIIRFWAAINNYIFSLWIKFCLRFQTCFKDIITTLFPRYIRLAHMQCAFYRHIPQLHLGDIGKTFIKSQNGSGCWCWESICQQYLLLSIFMEFDVKHIRHNKRWPGNGSAEGNGHCKGLSPRNHLALALAWLWPWTSCLTSVVLCFFIWKMRGLALGTPVEIKSMIHLWPTHLYPQIHQAASTSIIYIHLQVNSA